LLGKSPGEVGNFGVVFLPFGDLPCSGELGLLLLTSLSVGIVVAHVKRETHSKGILTEIDGLGLVEAILATPGLALRVYIS
jgi:hypothetical protein